MNKGTVKWFNNSRGYGFITMEDGTEIFVHWTGIVSDKKFKFIAEGQTVEFEITDGEKGKQAVNVTVIDNTSKEDFEKIVDIINRSAQNVLRENMWQAVFITAIYGRNGGMSYYYKRKQGSMHSQVVGFSKLSVQSWVQDEKGY